MLKSQELQDGKIDSGMEPQTTLVRSESRVELDSITPVDLQLSLIVLPDNPKLDNTLRGGDDRQTFLEFRVDLEEL